MSDTQQPSADMTATVYSNGGDLILAFLAERVTERASADLAAQGFKYAGSVSTHGVSTVDVGPGYSVAATRAGIAFVDKLGRR